LFIVIASHDLSGHGNLALGLFPLLSLGQAYYVPRNDILISDGLDESSPYIEMIKYFFTLMLSVGRHEVCPYILLITDHLSLVFYICLKASVGSSLAAFLAGIIQAMVTMTTPNVKQKTRFSRLKTV
jgi:hypothetical protein